MRGRGGVHGWGHAWWGVCVVGGMRGGGHAWWGHVWGGQVCMVKGGVHGKRGGMCGEGGVHGEGGHAWWGHAWQKEGACVAKGGVW